MKICKRCVTPENFPHVTFDVIVQPYKNVVIANPALSKKGLGEAISILKKYLFQSSYGIQFIELRCLQYRHKHTMVFGAADGAVTEGYFTEYDIGPNLLFGVVIVGIDVFNV